jgi:hypothetical protein
MKRTFLKLTMSAFVMSALFVTSCKKSTDASAKADETEVAIAQLDADTDVAFDDVYDNVMGNNDFGGSGNYGIYGAKAELSDNTDGTEVTGSPASVDSLGNRCFTVTVAPQNPLLWPKTVTIDFGTAGCVGPNGHTRYGKIITVYSSRMVMPGAVATTTFDNYKIDSFKIEGTHVVTNQSTALRSIWKVDVTNGKVSNLSNGNYRLRNATHTFTQVDGMLTPLNPFDDAIEITGNGSGTASYNGNMLQWSRTIQIPLLKKIACRWFVKGSVNITRNARTALLDFGNGNCDNQATLTSNGQTVNITLH